MRPARCQSFSRTALAICAVVAAACASSQNAPQVGADGGAGSALVRASDAGARAGRASDRVLRVVVDAEPVHLQPALDIDAVGQQASMHAIYEPLIRKNDSGGYDPVLAAEFRIDGEGRVATFHLRPEVVFHDGQALAATDVQFTIDRILSKKTHAPRIKALLADIERVELVSARTVRVHATKPSAFLLAALSEVPILPEHVFSRGELMYQGGNRHPVGTGPYRLAAWRRGQAIELEAFPRYWGTAPTFARVELAIETDQARALGRLRRREVDIWTRVPPVYAVEQIDSPSVKSAYRVEQSTGARTALVLWNTARPPLDEAPVRRALDLLADRARYAKDVRHGAAKPVSAPWPLAGGYDEALAPRYDRVEAERLLDQAGFARPTPSGVRARAGRPIRLSLLVPSGSFEAAELARLYAESLQKAGIVVEIVPGDLSVLSLRVRHGQFDGAVLEWLGRPSGDEDLSPLLSAKQGGVAAGPTIDALLEQLRHALPASERRALWGRLHHALVESVPVSFLYAATTTRLVSTALAATPLVDEIIALAKVAPAKALE